MRIARVQNKYAENYVQICALQDIERQQQQQQQQLVSNLTNDNKWKLLTDFISTWAEIA